MKKVSCEVSVDIGRADVVLAQMDKKQMLTVAQVARLLAVCGRTIRRLVAAGELNAPVHVGRASRWLASDVLEYQEKLVMRRDQKRQRCQQEVVS